MPLAAQGAGGHRRAMTDGVTLRDLETGDAGWLVERHAVLYARDDGFDASFGALVAEILAAYIRTRDPATERAFIALAQGRRVGSVVCMRGDEPSVARLRLFLVEPDWRGRGLGQRLLEACLGFAREAEYRRLRLRTHESHRAACALYARNGFRLATRRPVRSFGQDLVEQSWEIDLAGLAIAGVSG
jgi:GNAT superfamily N-acetyltransferase